MPDTSGRVQPDCDDLLPCVAEGCDVRVPLSHPYCAQHTSGRVLTPRRWHRWMVWDCPLGGILSPRPVVYTMTRRSAERFVERFNRSHHDTGCCSDCSSLWSYVVAPARTPTRDTP